MREGFIFTQLAHDKKDNFLQKYLNLKALLLAEISVISKRVFNDLKMNMRKVFHEEGILNLNFDEKSMLLIGVSTTTSILLDNL